MNIAKFLFIRVFTVMILILNMSGCGKGTEPEKKPEYEIGWKQDLDSSTTFRNNWEVKGKPGTPAADFHIVKTDSGGYLNMKSDKASASVVTRVEVDDPSALPVLRWRWRAKELPDGADARLADKDDQAIGIYIGTGSMLSKKAVAYHWDTETPAGTEGKSTYGLGTIKVKWITLRNRNAPMDTWLTEERNFIQDFKEAWGFVPENIYISVSCNSQYTGTLAEADLDWIGLSDR